MAVANICYAQPLLGQIGRHLGVGRAGLGLVTTVTQAGYFLGLILIVPLGDLVNQRLLIVAGCVIAAAALVSVAVSPGPQTFLVASGALADRGGAQWVTEITLVLFAISWAPIAWLPNSLIVLIIGIVVLNLAGQAISVTDQLLIVEIDPTASLIGGNTVYYAIGTGGGAIAATTVYGAWAGAPSAFSGPA